MTLQALTLAILVLPAAGSVGLGLGALRVPRRLVQVVGPGTVWVAFLCSLVLFVDQLTNGGRSHDFTYWTWLSSGDLQVPVDLFVDRLSVFMCLIVTGVGGLIVTYSNGYMEHETDGSYARFFCYMDLFITSMLLLVLAGNLVLLIVGWAGVGLSSYLLIGFFYWRWSAVVAARKAFVMNVIGDVGMILGTFVLFAAYHSVTYAGIFAALPKTDSPLLELAAFLLLVGAVAKSAQLPLHTWLPDAMEGPTPVSALIHAATMVTAGVYLVGRLHPLYDLAWIAHGAVALIGTMTALFAASIAIVQTDIKRVLAYSTMSQIGYMFLAVGVGAYAAGFFHLMAHAFFKALLFLGAGNVIHSMNDEQDMRRYGGLWGQMRGTSICFLIGSLSLAGIIPFVGFWSKEVVLGDVFSKPDAGGFPQAMWAIGFATAILTGFYTGRMWWMAFSGGPSPERPVARPHEAQAVMMVPVVVLAVLSTVGGFVQINAGFHPGWKLIEDWLAPTFGPLPWQARDLEYIPTAATLLLAGLAFWPLADAFYRRRIWSVWSERLPFLQRLLERKYYADELYDRLFVRPMDAAAEAGDQLLEAPVIDAAPAGVGATARGGAGILSLAENGLFRTYALVMLAAALVGLVIVFAVRG
ncbi:MAG TPA: NADH-quinone oxidoreductase subunit L [Candidatus Dormibacteraeota bacterium]|nr:NADH-quinone oxidoreductase subunit L [Candidatus Dormibacteraeota bacterium]